MDMIGSWKPRLVETISTETGSGEDIGKPVPRLNPVSNIRFSVSWTLLAS